MCQDQLLSRRTCVTHQVHIAQLIEPEVIDGCCGCRKVILSEPPVDLIHSKCAATQDPTVNDSLFASCLWVLSEKERDRARADTTPQQ